VQFIVDLFRFLNPQLLSTFPQMRWQNQTEPMDILGWAANPSFYVSSLNVKAITFGSATTLTNVAFAAVATVSTHARLWIGGQRQPNITLG
jgi:hypothetical protein